VGAVATVTGETSSGERAAGARVEEGTMASRNGGVVAAAVATGLPKLEGMGKNGILTPTKGNGRGKGGSPGEKSMWGGNGKGNGAGGTTVFATSVDKFWAIAGSNGGGKEGGKGKGVNGGSTTPSGKGIKGNGIAGTGPGADDTDTGRGVPSNTANCGKVWGWPSEQ
jgi:hypothetical protein